MARLSEELLPFFILQLREQHYSNLTIREVRDDIEPKYRKDFPDDVVRAWERDVTEWRDAIPEKKRKEMIASYEA